MKTRESGMPAEAVWDEFFDPPRVIDLLGIRGLAGDVAEFGCGYGTFTVGAARGIHGAVYAIDIEPEMVRATQTKANAGGLNNVRVLLRDFVASGTGLADASVAYAMLFNILHCKDPWSLLREAYRVLLPGGSVGIIHWNYDPSTPRGPSMDIRPRPQQCLAWAEAAGFRVDESGVTDLPPYHYGFRAQRV
jgi:ubiquinone/menaquinone biosynthesis C-methylase UbiE